MVSTEVSYKSEVTRAMKVLGSHPRSIFLGQTVLYGGSALSDTMKDVPKDKLCELPVAEEMQMGMSIGLALAGYLPISIYPRIDFLLLAINQLSNHLDVISELTHGEFKAKVIIRTTVGSQTPLYPGIQHCRDHTEVFRSLLKNVEVVNLSNVNQVMGAYAHAAVCKNSVLIVENAEMYLE